MISFFKKLAKSKVIRPIISLIGGGTTFLATAGVGLDVEYAILVAAATLVAIFVGVDKSIAFFTALNDSRNNKNHKK